MGCSAFNKMELEAFTGHKPIPLNITNEVMKSVCKIIITYKEGNHFETGTGFFLKYSNTQKYLITNYHVINPDLEKEKIEIEIYNKKIMRLNFIKRFTKYIERPKDISIIEIKESDEIFKDIKFLDYDLNYQNGYALYKNADVFTIQHPKGEDASCASGKIINIYNEDEFNHNISTDHGSSGCPIILLNNNINLLRVIGIHKEGQISKKLNGGTFIGEILNKVLIKKKIRKIILLLK